RAPVRRACDQGVRATARRVWTREGSGQLPSFCVEHRLSRTKGQANFPGAAPGRKSAILAATFDSLRLRFDLDSCTTARLGYGVARSIPHRPSCDIYPE